MTELQYFPSIAAYVSSIKGPGFDTRGDEPFRRMSFRNRCIIASASGPLTLSIPVEGGRGVRLPYRDVTVCERGDWRARHWKSIASAYGRSPWFFHHADRLEALYRTPAGRLMEWNLACLEWVDAALGLHGLQRRAVSVPDAPGLRDGITPRNYREHASCGTYTQVFSEKTGFLPNLSILDFVMCAGRPQLGRLGL
jgi:hypothetical protein